jgi:hypothetical protein
VEASSDRAEANIIKSGEETAMAAEGTTKRPAALLRQLWLLLKGRCYSPWMLWLAAALDRAGEQELACEAAAQGLLPVCCSYWGIGGVNRAHGFCLEALLPHLAHSGEVLLGRWTIH